VNRPVIAITVDTSHRAEQYESPCAYSTAIEKAGGLPLLLPYRTDLSLIPQIVDLCDGVLFSGGDDLDPALYGEQWHPHAARIDPARQTFELALLAEVERRRVPALGICLGCQLMNVHRGGSLIQFLPDHPRPNPIEHRKLDDPTRRHDVTLVGGSAIASAIGRTTLSVNTSHKQAIRTPGRGLRIIATAPDGIIEGIEDPTMPLYAAVQWHPERLHEEKEHLAPFKMLVTRALEHMVAEET